MRALFVIGSVGLAMSATAPLRAADYEYAVAGVRAAPQVIYDYEPGIVVRAYWLPPWRNHHYFPRGQKIKAVVPRGAASRPMHRIRPAQDFHREWSTPSGCNVCAADTPYPGLRPAQQSGDGPRAGNGESVIHADADVTVLGPDRMDIRLFRKRGNGSAE